MAPVYATPEDVAAAPWGVSGTEPQLARMLAFAARLVRRATVTAIYDADANGLPTDTTLKAAFRDATCSQVATWVELSVKPASGAADAGKTIMARSLGSASVQYSAYAATVDARARATTRLSEDAWAILNDAGLTGLAPLVYG